MASKQLVVFSIEGREFCVEITNVKEIIRMVEIYKVPNVPAFVEGLINLRGKIHTIFNLRKIFNLPARLPDENTRIIMVDVRAMVVGFIVDGVKEIIRVDDEDIENALQEINETDNKFINSVAKVGDRIVMMLDLESIIALSSRS